MARVESTNPSRGAVEPVRLRLIQAMLALLALGFVVVGARYNTWPVITWPMYRVAEPEVPPPVLTATHLRVTAEDGSVEVFHPVELMPAARDDAAVLLIERAFDPQNQDRDAHRRYLTHLAARATGDEVVLVEALDRTWEVDPYAARPLDRDEPVREAITGSYVPAPDERSTADAGLVRARGLR